MTRERVGILTDLTTRDPAYSLTNVTADQLRMFLAAGYEPVLVVDQVFRPDSEPWSLVEVRKLPGLPRDNVLRQHETWEADLETMTAAMREALEGLTCVLTHDLIYQCAIIQRSPVG